MPPAYFGFVWYRALAQLRSESTRAYLGYLWWILEPLLYLLVFYLVFGLIFNRGDEDYVLVLLTGLVVWKWFDGAVRASMDVIQHNAALIDRVYLPKIVLPSVCVVGNGVKFALVMSLLLLFSLIFGNGISVHWLALPLLIAVELLLVFSASCLVAAVTPFVPDIRMVFDKFMTLLFFLSGIFYSAQAVPESLRDYFLLLPTFALIEQFRRVIVYAAWPDPVSLLLICLLSTLTLALAVTLLRRFDRIYPRLVY